MSATAIMRIGIAACTSKAENILDDVVYKHASCSHHREVCRKHHILASGDTFTRSARRKPLNGVHVLLANCIYSLFVSLFCPVSMAVSTSLFSYMALVSLATVHRLTTFLAKHSLCAFAKFPYNLTEEIEVLCRSCVFDVLRV